MKTDWTVWAKKICRLAFSLCFCVCTYAVAAESAETSDFSRAAVPEPLKTWVPWALDEVPDAACPHLFNRDAPRQCVWPGVLELKADSRGAAFAQYWRVYRPTWVELPGETRYWPQDVQVDGKPAVVIGRSGVPSVRLEEGSHRLSGRFAWRALPESLALPARAALLHLEVDGKIVARPVRDEDNQLRLQGRSEREAGDEAQIHVYRKLADGVPVTVETRIRLDVSGKARELRLGRILLPGTLPQDLRSPLPAALTQAGGLRVQARAGRWDITLIARYPGVVKALTLAGEGSEEKIAGKADTVDNRDNGQSEQGGQNEQENRPGEPPADAVKNTESTENAEATSTGEAPLLADEEAWVFQADPSIRSATVEGVASVDPQQTDLPMEWRRLPSYLMRPGETLTLKEIRRGDSDPAPDRLSLERQAWLSFDGGTLTVSDRLSGEIGRARRLEVAAPAKLGRVDIDGEAQLITRSGEAEDTAGVEVKRGRLTMSADSEISGAPHRFSAIGWQHDAERLNMTLNLPAGWRLLHASGVDRAGGAWLAQWNLLDFFLVMLTALAAGRLWGVGWGAVALLAMMLVYQEADAPTWDWLLLIAAVALYRVLPEGRMKRGMHFIRCAGALLLTLHLLSFAVDQVRMALYPVLEGDGLRTAQAGTAQPYSRNEMDALREDEDAAVQEEAIDAREAPQVMAMPAPEAVQLEKVPAKMAAAPRHAASSSSMAAKSAMRARQRETPMQAAKRNIYQIADPDAKVQTGNGLPNWRWNVHSLTWNGPVAQDQMLDLWLLSPLANKLLVVLRLALLAGLLARILDLVPRAAGKTGGMGGPGGGRSWGWLGGFARKEGAPPAAQYAHSGRAQPAVLLVVLGLVLTAGLSGPVRAELPNKALLDALREKLTRPAECLPECADISRLSVHLADGSLRLILDVEAVSDVALPLPGGVKQWLASEARIDGKPAYVYTENENAWLLAPAGRSRVELFGVLPAADVVQLPLPLRPRRVEVQADGWEVAGISEESGVADTLQFSRRAEKDSAADAARAARGRQEAQNAQDAAVLPPFLRVERRLFFDLNWRVETTVRRVSPPGAPVVVQVPLLPGESVTTAGIVVKEGQAQVNLAPQATSVGWVSTLAPHDALTLTAPKTDAWVESWMMSASPLWHVDAQGFPPVALGTDAQDADLSFRPWPGETLRLSITRPQPAPGRTLTIDASALAVTAGARSSDYHLSLSLRSSRGADHTLTLPEGAVLQRVAIDGKTQPIRLDGQRLTLPLAPGKQGVEILWRAEQDMALRYATQRVDLGQDSVNHRVQLQLPRDRWLLLAVGPGIGPAILFWGKLLVLLVAAVLIGRFSARDASWPLRRTWQWLLLALGLTQASWWSALIVIGWFAVFGWRARQSAAVPLNPAIPTAAGESEAAKWQARMSSRLSHWPFNLRQIGLALLTLVMLSALFSIVESGLLGYPDMQVVGNGSHAFRLNWYLDRAEATPPGAWVVTLPILVYRGLMLLWALWLAWSLLDWLKWGWNAFSAGGLWRRRSRVQA